MTFLSRNPLYKGNKTEYFLTKAIVDQLVKEYTVAL